MNFAEEQLQESIQQHKSKIEGL